MKTVKEVSRKPKTVKEVLRDALAKIEPRAGWTKGWFRLTNAYGKTCYCAMGAINHSTSNHRLRVGAMKRLLRAIGLGPDGSIPAWNDDPKRTKSQVVAAFRKALEIA